MRFVILAAALLFLEGESTSWAGDTESAWIEVSQQQIPTLKAREVAALAKVEAITQFLQGDGSVRAALGDIDVSRLNNPTILRGRIHQLQQESLDRGAERLSSRHDLGSKERESSLQKALIATHDVEDRASHLETRILSDALALLQADPMLTSVWSDALFAQEHALLESELPSGGEPLAEAEVAAQEGRTAKSAARIDSFKRLVSTIIIDGLRSESRSVAVEQVDSIVWEQLLVAPYLDGSAELESALLQTMGDLELSLSSENLNILAAVLEEGDTRAGPLRSASQSMIARAIAGRTAELDTAAISDKSTKEAEKSAIEARAAAEEAQREASDQASQERATQLGWLAQAEQQREELSQRSLARQEARSGVMESLEASISKIESEMQILKTKPNVGGRRVVYADAIFSQTRTLMKKIRGLKALYGEQLATAQDELDQVLAAQNPQGERVAESRAASIRIAREYVETEERHEEKLYAMLKDTVILHQSLKAEVSSSADISDRGYLLQDVRDETRTLLPNTAVRIASRLQDIRSLPSRLLDFNLLTDLLLGSFWLIVGVITWILLRSRTGEVTAFFERILKKALATTQHHERVELRTASTRFISAFGDLIFGWVLIGPISAMVPELGFLLLIYLQVAIFRATVALFDLLVVPSSQIRPSLVLLPDDERKQVRLLLAVVVIWAIGRNFVTNLLWGVLFAPGLNAIVISLVDIVAVVWVLVLLLRSESVLRRRINTRGANSSLSKWLVDSERHRLLKPVKIVIMFVALLWGGATDVVESIAQRKTGLAQVFNMISRARIAVDDNKVWEPISEEMAARIMGQVETPSLLLKRPDLWERIDRALQDWIANDTRGVAALVGDRGEGKSLAIREFVGRHDDGDLRFCQWTVQERLLTEAALLSWMSEQLSCGPLADVSAAIDALTKLDSSVIIVQRLHRVFLRSVDGFEALRALNLIVNATSKQHFWLLSCHQPAWEFLTRIADSSSMTPPPTVVVLPPMSPIELKEMIQKRSSAAGLTISYASLVSNTGAFGDKQSARIRAENIYFRLLADASGGNPTIALALWRRSLEQGSDESTVVLHLEPVIDHSSADGMSDDDLFLLMALRVHDQLETEHLSSVTNMPKAVLQALERRLVADGLIDHGPGGLRVIDSMLPIVNRTLIRRHIMH